MTTTAGDGSSSELFGVSLTNVDAETKTWNGNDEVVFWTISVENTGQMNETIQLDIEEGGESAKCKGGYYSNFLIELSDTELQLEGGESENIQVQLEIEDTSAVDKVCWTVNGVVSNDPQQNASDSTGLSIVIPEVHACDIQIPSGTSIEVDPGETKSKTVEVWNTGNSDFTLELDKSGSKAHWIEITPSNQLLRESQSVSFNVEVTPDATVSAGNEQIINLKGLDGINGAMICNTQLGVIVGQFSDASLSLPTTTMSEVNPGETTQLQFSILNDGNGADSFSVGLSTPPSGWTLELSENSFSIQEGGSASATMNVTVPENALADEAAQITISVSPNNGGAAYDSKVVTIPVSAVHSIGVEKLAGDQTGRSNEYVKFPVKITNQGNIQDTYEFSVTARTQDWDYSFIQENGDPISTVQISAGQDDVVYLKVRIPECESGNPEDCELDSSLFTVRYWNKADATLKIELQMRAILSNRNFTMSMYFAEPESNPSTKTISLAPGGSKEIEIWAYNSGDLDDTAIFEITGIEGKGTRSISINDEVINDAILIKKGYGIYNPVDGTFLSTLQNNQSTPVIYFEETDADEYMWLNGYGETHIVKEYAVLAVISIEVSSTTENGYSGMITINIASEHNSAEIVALNIIVDVETVHDLDLETSSKDKDIQYPDNAWFRITVTNNGNVDETVVVSVSEGLRDWTVIIPEEAEQKFVLKPGESKTIDIKVEPPDTTLDDKFEFVVSVEPEDVGITARKNIELSVEGSTTPGIFGILGKTNQKTMIGGLIIVLILGMGIFFLEKRFRGV